MAWLRSVNGTCPLHPRVLADADYRLTNLTSHDLTLHGTARHGMAWQWAWHGMALSCQSNCSDPPSDHLAEMLTMGSTLCLHPLPSRRLHRFVGACARGRQHAAGLLASVGPSPLARGSYAVQGNLFPLPVAPAKSQEPRASDTPWCTTQHGLRGTLRHWKSDTMTAGAIQAFGANNVHQTATTITVVAAPTDVACRRYANVMRWTKKSRDMKVHHAS